MSPERPRLRSDSEIVTSAMHLLDRSTLYMLFLPLEYWGKIARESGYRGFQWHPIRIGLPAIQLARGALSWQAKDSIRSGHQSSRNETNPLQVWRHPNRSLAAISFVTLPDQLASLNNLERLQNVVGRKLPVVLYPPHRKGEESGTQRPFGEKLVQPTPEIMRMWGVKTVQQLIEEVSRRGYTGFCLDLLHMREIGKPDLSPWQETLPKLLSFTEEIHVSAGRTDVAYRPGLVGVDSKAELNDLHSGQRKTELSHILMAIRDLRWHGRIVTEIPASSIKAALGSKGQFLSPRTLTAEHRQIARVIRGLATIST